MKIRFRTNLGTRDAEPLRLDATKCQSGDEADTSVKLAQYLVAKGYAEAAEDWPQPEEPKPPKVEAVPAPSTIAEKKPEAKPIEAKEEAKPQPKATTTTKPQSKGK